ncbi:hypothetical protein [Leptospirillum ferriphilum]|uniref:hypothetical protein n=1 Tax=Leptospirillum ferriphilum TaxID=178606 RepID=UPI0006B19A0B|nr:hypothetical protein [Leptospirillum ferriphilum]
MDSKELLLSIAHCSEVKRFLASKDIIHPCSKIVLSQASPFQLPEPWNGNLVFAPILFISSNPSINEKEEYPDYSWEDSHIVSFFENRFQGDQTYDRRVLLKSGEHSQKVKYWNELRIRTAEILQCAPEIVEFGKDFSITEVVHCKSRKNKGVKESLDICSQKYLKKILEVSGAKLLVILGKFARMGIKPLLVQEGLPSDQIFIKPSDFLGQERCLVFLPQPGSAQKRKFESCLSKEDFPFLLNWFRR